MSNELLDPVHLRERGFEVLVRELGWVNAVRFIQQYESSRFNYTLERDQILPCASAEDLVREMSAIAAEKAGQSKH